jgi:nitroreductase
LIHRKHLPMNLIDLLNWRYAAKKMDPSKPVAADKLERILEAVRLAPTSSGLQPFEVVVVSRRELLVQLQQAARGQSQVADCAHLLVFAAWDDYTVERINQMFDLTNRERGFTNEGWEAYRGMLLKSYPSRGGEVNFQHAARQAYIGLGVALVAAAAEQVDSTPMEGFDPVAVDALLGLRERGLRSVAIMPLGHRHAGQDWLEPLKKVRRAMADFVTRVE